MIKRTVSDLKPYDAPGHYNMVAMRYHGKEETGAEKFWIGKSTFLPGGGAEWAYDDNPLEKVYFVLKGEMTVTDKDGKEYVLMTHETATVPVNALGTKFCDASAHRTLIKGALDFMLDGI